MQYTPNWQTIFSYIFFVEETCFYIYIDDIFLTMLTTFPVCSTNKTNIEDTINKVIKLCIRCLSRILVKAWIEKKSINYAYHSLLKANEILGRLLPKSQLLDQFVIKARQAHSCDVRHTRTDFYT
jgi:DNA-directed RNA polymerase subunit RPC12/RpoP